MKDFFGEFQRTRMRKLTIAMSAFVIAAGANVAIFQTNMGQQLQANVLGNTAQSVVQADLSLESATGSDIAKISLQRSLPATKEVRFSLVYNPESLKINDVFSGNTRYEITKISNVPGYMLINIRLKSPDTIPAGEFLTISTNRLTATPGSINMIEAQFVSEGATYQLSTSGGLLP
jgi:hypothetical protein